MADEPSIFTKIINGDIPGEFVYKDDVCVAIRDINPVAPVHILIIPREPVVNVYDVTENHKDTMGHLIWVAAQIAKQEKIDNGFRLVINNGEDARQEVMHLHMHLIAGEKLGSLGKRG